MVLLPLKLTSTHSGKLLKLEAASQLSRSQQEKISVLLEPLHPHHGGR
jgi:hypothetical protein